MRHWMIGTALLLGSTAYAYDGWMYGGGSYSSQQKITLEYSSGQRGVFQIQLYRLTKPEQLLSLGGPQEFQGTGELSLSPYKRFVVRSDGNYSNLVLPKLPAGMYLAQLEGANKKALSAVLIQVSDLGLVVKSDATQTLFYTAQLQDGKPMPSEVFVVKNRKTVFNNYLAKGLGTYPINPGEGSFVAAKSGSSWAFSGRFWQSWNSLSQKTYVTTDRPVYKPGDTVYFKATARKIDQLAPIANQSMDVIVKDTSDREVYRVPLVSDAYGSVNGQFKLGLDSNLGDYTIYVGNSEVWGSNSVSFAVQEYRKPEYQVSVATKTSNAIQGDTISATIKAEYLFGGGVSQGQVRYSVIKTPLYRWGYTSEYGFYAADNYSPYSGDIIKQGEGVLDAKGELTLPFTLPKDSQDYSYRIEANVTDEANHEQSGNQTIMAYRAGVILDIQLDKYAYTLDDTVMATIKATDLDGQPVAVDFNVRSVRSYWEKTYQEEKVGLLSGRTNADGEAIVRLKLPKQGSYTLVAEAKDRQGRSTDASNSLWLSDGSAWWWNYNDLSAKTDKAEYRLGDNVRFVVQSPVSDGYALLTEEGDSLSNAKVVRFNGNVLNYSLPVTDKMRPNGYLGVTILGKGQYYQQTVGFKAPPVDKFLQLKLSSDKNVYAPGDTARYQVDLKDANGAGVQGQISFGLIDEGVYLVKPDQTTDIRGFFYALRGNVVGTETSSSFYFGNARPVAMASNDMAAEAMAGARPLMEKAVFAQAKGEMAKANVRKDFQDTAAWLPNIETNTDGRAEFSVRLPENLTTWRLTGRAISQSDLVGQNTYSVKTTLPVIARLSQPNFLVRGDRAQVTVIGQGSLPDQAGQLTLDTTGVERLGVGSQAVTIGNSARASATFGIIATQAGVATLQASALTASNSDALEQKLTVLPRGVKSFSSWAGQQGQQWTVNLPAKTNPQSLKATLFVTPSLLGTVAPALSYLAGYPYGCTEQTLSRFVPTLLAKRVGGLAQLPADATANLDEYVEAGLKRLYDFQHSDGGWGFWQNDASSTYNTAHVLNGLLEAKVAGYKVRPEVLSQAVKYLQMAQTQKDWDADARLYAFYVLARAGYAPTVSPELAIKEATPYGLGLAALGYQKLDRLPEANVVLDKLLKRLTVTSTSAYWALNSNAYAWDNDEIEAAGYGLQAISLLRPNTPELPKLVNWILSQRRGAAWISTKDTAAIIAGALTLAQVQPANTATPTINVWVNGKKVRTETLRDPSQGVEIPLDSLNIGQNNTVSIDSDSLVFASGSAEYVEESDYLKPQYDGVRVARTYEKLSLVKEGDKYVYTRSAARNEANVGDVLLVTVTVKPEKNQDLRYLMVNEPIPAGFSAIDDISGYNIDGYKPRYGYDYYDWNEWYDGREVRQDRIDYYFNRLSGEATMTYMLRAEAAGDYTVLPTQAWMMYNPDVRGSGIVRRFTVNP